jgi:hypothetical protein
MASTSGVHRSGGAGQRIAPGSNIEVVQSPDGLKILKAEYTFKNPAPGKIFDATGLLESHLRQGINKAEIILNISGLREGESYDAFYLGSMSGRLTALNVMINADKIPKDSTFANLSFATNREASACGQIELGGNIGVRAGTLINAKFETFYA